MILALDLGTRCGWAVLSDDGCRVAGGHWRLETSRAVARGPRPRPASERFTIFLARLREVLAEHPVSAIVYDRVTYGSTSTVRLAGGWAAIVALAAFEAGAEVVEISTDEALKVAGVKKLRPSVEPSADARRAALKAAMVEAARAAGCPAETDDEADAYWIGRTLLHKKGCK